ncbi:MAG: hypothetical protein AAFV88_11670 [Planctomycetota bacterium]
MRQFIFCMMIAIGSTCSAELKLVINGPTEAKVGEAIILDTKGTVANAKNWILPESIRGKVLQCNEQLGFFPEKAGEYRIILHGTDGVVLGHKEIVITVEPRVPPVVDEPDDPPGDKPIEDDPPSAGYQELEKLSHDLADEVDEPETRSKLASRLKTVDYDQSPEMVDQAIDQTIRRVLVERPRESDSDWQTGWFRPLIEQLSSMADDGAIKDVSDLERAMEAVIRGLNG